MASPAPRPARPPLWGLGALGLLWLGLTACGHYHLGPGGAGEIRTLFIAPVGQTRDLPQANALITTAVREAFLRDGRVRLASSPAAADAVLTLNLGDYRRETATVQAADTGLARKFDLMLDVTARLESPRDGRVWFAARSLPVRRQAYVDQGQLQAEYQALPHLAAALADQVVHAVLDVW
jgi:outer membrane lipopolysaccharide assembly protein LptE/RlpB